MPGWEELGMQAAGNAVGGIMGLAFGSIENQRQLKQQERMNQMDWEQHQRFSEFNREQQMKLWRDTNYSAQMAELKKAGLNPALLYGKGGGAGGTTAAAVGGSGSHSASARNDIMNGMGLQLGLQAAQIENIKANTNKTNVEAAKTAGVDTTEAWQRIGIMQVEQDIAEMEKEVKGRTIEDAIDIITAEAGKATFETLRTQRFNQIEQATVESTITQIQARAVGALLDNALTKANIKVAEEQVKKLAADIAQGWKSLDQKDTQLIIDKWVEENKANNPSIGDVFGKLFNNALEEIRNVTKPKYRGYQIPTKK